MKDRSFRTYALHRRRDSGNVFCIVQAFFAKWGDSGVVDLNKELTELIILTASRTLMGNCPFPDLRLVRPLSTQLLFLNGNFVSRNVSQNFRAEART